MKNISYELIVIGASFGGIDALKYLIPKLAAITNIPIVIVQHIKHSQYSNLAGLLNINSNNKVKEAEERESIRENTIYIAPAGYHLYIEDNKHFALSIDDLVQFSRPSIDVLFESAANTYKRHVIGILLTGANNDGAAGMLAIHQQDGLTIAEDPKSAKMATMPQSAIDLFDVDYIVSLDKIPNCLSSILGGD